MAECEIDGHYSSTKQMSTWIDKGIWLGKKAVITGAVVSSAPLVLPPLVVFSTLGLACSVPFGFVFATYACTQKIMSKLLPTPDSSPLSEYDKDDMEDVDFFRGVVEQEYDDLLQQGYVEEYDDLVQKRAEEQGYEEDEEAEVKLEQVPEEQEMKDTSAEVKEGDNLQENQIDTLGFGVTSMELDGRDDFLPQGAALSQKDVFYGQDGIQIYNEEPLEQEKLMLDVLKGTGMENMLYDAITSINTHKQNPVAEEIQFKEVVEGAATMIELNVNDIIDPESGHSYQAHVYDEKNSFAVLREESDEIKRGTLMGNDMDGEARNETQEGSTSQANEFYAHKNVKERPIKIIEHSHEGGNKEDATKHLQVEDALSVEETEVRNEKLIIEDMNEKPVIEMRQVIVSVPRGKKIADEQNNEDIEDSQKLVLVAKKVVEETVGDIKSVVECNILGDLNSASHEGGNKEDTTKYLQVEDALSVEETEVRNEKLIIEDMNEKPVIETRQVIVSVHCGKKIAGEQNNEDTEDSQKLVLVAKKVVEETVGDIKSVVERNSLGDLNSAREIADECGLDLFNYTAGNQDSYIDFNHSQENDNIRSSETDDVSNLPVLRVSTKVAKSKHMNLQPETDPITPFNEVLLNEENIWEQIDALRAIVGYSAPTHTTSVEEIKALYVFIGVEPPPSLADNTDLVEMNEKLRLLKSVVGVK